MPDLLTHVLVPYVVLTVASWRLAVEDRWIPVAMGGAAVPDLVKVELLLDDALLERILGIPFSFAPISSVGGLLAIAAGIAVAFEAGERRRAYAWLVFGGLTALGLDGLRAFADGRAGFWLFPVWWRPPTPGLYVTADVRVLAVALILAGVVFLADRRLASGGTPDNE